MNLLSPAIAADFAAIAYETLQKVSLNSTDYYSRISKFFSLDDFLVRGVSSSTVH